MSRRRGCRTVDGRAASAVIRAAKCWAIVFLGAPEAGLRLPASQPILDFAFFLNNSACFHVKTAEVTFSSVIWIVFGDFLNESLRNRFLGAIREISL